MTGRRTTDGAKGCVEGNRSDDGRRGAWPTVGLERGRHAQTPPLDWAARISSLPRPTDGEVVIAAVGDLVPFGTEVRSRGWYAEVALS